MTDHPLRTRIFTSLLIGLGVSACGGQTGGGSGGSAGASDASGGSGGTQGSGASGGVDASGGTYGFGGNAGGTFDAGVDAPPDAGYCSYGTPTYTCLTPAEAQAAANNPPFGGDAPPDDAGLDSGASDAGVDENGCPYASRIQDGCCNPASAGPSFEAGLCCYVFCTGGCCGRPFTVAGSARKASLTGKAPPSQRDSLGAAALEAARQWREDGLMEHASVAAFARHCAELIGLGAPRRLVRASLSAQRDEVLHAALCFDLAEQLDGAQQQPGELPTLGALDDVNAAGVLARLISEGCIEETIAAAIAAEQLALATHEPTRRALQRIADDEARHAAHSWECLAWLLSTGALGLRQQAERQFANLSLASGSPRRELAPSLPANEALAALHEFGRLSDAETANVRQRVLRQVIEPSWLSLQAELARRSVPKQGQPRPTTSPALA